MKLHRCRRRRVCLNSILTIWRHLGAVVRKKIIGQIQLYGNLPYKCSIQQKRQNELVKRDRMNSIRPMIFFRTTDTRDTTDTTIWKPGLRAMATTVRKSPKNVT